MSRPDEAGERGGRLVGVRTPYDAAPPQIHSWAEEILGARYAGGWAFATESALKRS